MSGDRQLLYDYVEQMKFPNPKRKMLLLGLVRRAIKHYGMELLVGDDVPFHFKVDPIELQGLLEVNLEIVAMHLSVLEKREIESTMVFQNSLDWYYKVSILPLMRMIRNEARIS